MLFWYKNSFLASVVSLIGCSAVLAGIANFGDDPTMAVLCIVVGIVLAIWGKNISDNKSFNKWWKQIEEKNLEPVIAKDLNTAVAIYNKNPQDRTLQKIASLNPAFAEHIRKSIAAKK